jgi:hypothetical protein
LHYTLNVACLIGRIDAEQSTLIDKVSRLGAVLRVMTLNKQLLYFGTHKNPMYFTANGSGGQKVADLNAYKLEFTTGSMFPPYFNPAA